jgi:hypothetical protein
MVKGSGEERVSSSGACSPGGLLGATPGCSRNWTGESMGRVKLRCGGPDVRRPGIAPAQAGVARAGAAHLRVWLTGRCESSHLP